MLFSIARHSFAGRDCHPVRVAAFLDLSSVIYCLSDLVDLFSTLSCHGPRVLSRPQRPASLTENLRRFTDLGAWREQRGRAWPVGARRKMTWEGNGLARKVAVVPRVSG